jgi:hypothetical protein
MAPKPWSFQATYRSCRCPLRAPAPEASDSAVSAGRQVESERVAVIDCPDSSAALILASICSTGTVRSGLNSCIHECRNEQVAIGPGGCIDLKSNSAAAASMMISSPRRLLEPLDPGSVRARSRPSAALFQPLHDHPCGYAGAVPTTARADWRRACSPRSPRCSTSIAPEADLRPGPHAGSQLKNGEYPGHDDCEQDMIHP